VRVDRHIPLFSQLGQGAHMIEVAMREHDCFRA
jgi:hypothetical protein